MTGSAYALGAAFFWAAGVILFKKSQGTFSPVPLNIYKSIVALVLLTGTMLIFKVPFFPGHPHRYWILLSLSGFLGITLADLLFFIALDRLGAGFLAVVECFYLPCILLFSFVLLDESLSAPGIAGTFLILGAIGLGSVSFRQRPQDKALNAQISFIGLGAGFLSMILLAWGIVMVKDVLEQTHVLWATLVRVAAGILPLGIIVLFHPKRDQYLKELKFSNAWLTALPASISANFLALLCWIAGMKYTTVSRAAILNQMSTIFIFILAALFLKERITVNKSIAIILAVAGAWLTIVG